MYKIFRSKHLEMAMMAGIVESEGIKRARSHGVPTTIEGVDGLIKDGDIITIDIPNRRIDVDADLEDRKKDFKWKFDTSKYPRYLNLFAKNVGSMAHGGIWE